MPYGHIRQYIQTFPIAQMSEQEWEYIPKEAFLYFPSGEEIKSGSGQKQWRKIFEGGMEYETFEEEALEKLERKLKEKEVSIDSWFDKPNKLRFLQANKFKTSNSIQSMQETTKWRSKEFPITIDAATTKMLNSGAFYFCGRDDKYRPIMVADIGKFDADDVDIIPKTLAVVMEFMMDNMLVEGQVENYILVMNLQEANFSLRNVIMKILSFTSNAYRGRLFASYILSMPTIIRWGWDSIISKFVSQNTLKKIKITGERTHEDMWNHVSKDIIEQQYGGNMRNLQSGFWPPNKQLLKFVNLGRQAENNLITPEKYLSLFNDGKLKGRKVLKSLVYKEQAKAQHKLTNVEGILNNSIQRMEQEPPFPLKEAPDIKTQVKSKESMVNIDLQENRTHLIIQMETSFIKDFLTIKTFFQTPSFRKICTEVGGQ